MRFPSFWAAGGAAMLLAGCGLISSDVSRITVDLPSQTYTFDTSMWGNIPTGATFPSIPCTSDPDCCSLPTVNCTMTPLVCDNSVCEAQIPESVSTTVSLAGQPGLTQTASLVKITISSITYAVSNNTMNVDLPPFIIYMAPNNVTSPSDTRAIAFGTVPAIPAGTNPSGQVQLMANSAATFEMFTGNISVPFNLIAATTVDIPGGSPIPSGHITVTVSGTLSAQL
jgi:hypothetical protein